MTNNASEPETRLPAPKMWLLTRHDKFSMEHLIERYIEFFEETEDGRRAESDLAGSVETVFPPGPRLDVPGEPADHRVEQQVDVDDDHGWGWSGRVAERIASSSNSSTSRLSAVRSTPGRSEDAWGTSLYGSL